MKIKIDKKLVDNVIDETKRYHADATKDKFLILKKARKDFTRALGDMDNSARYNLGVIISSIALINYHTRSSKEVAYDMLKVLGVEVEWN